MIKFITDNDDLKDAPKSLMEYFSGKSIEFILPELFKQVYFYRYILSGSNGVKPNILFSFEEELSRYVEEYTFGRYGDSAGITRLKSITKDLFLNKNRLKYSPKEIEEVLLLFEANDISKKLIEFRTIDFSNIDLYREEDNFSFQFYALSLREDDGDLSLLVRKSRKFENLARVTHNRKSLLNVIEKIREKISIMDIVSLLGLSSVSFNSIFDQSGSISSILLEFIYRGTFRSINNTIEVKKFFGLLNSLASLGLLEVSTSDINILYSMVYRRELPNYVLMNRKYLMDFFKSIGCENLFSVTTFEDDEEDNLGEDDNDDEDEPSEDEDDDVGEDDDPEEDSEGSDDDVDDDPDSDADGDSSDDDVDEPSDGVDNGNDVDLTDSSSTEIDIELTSKQSFDEILFKTEISKRIDGWVSMKNPPFDSKTIDFLNNLNRYWLFILSKSTIEKLLNVININIK